MEAVPTTLAAMEGKPARMEGYYRRFLFSAKDIANLDNKTQHRVTRYPYHGIQRVLHLPGTIVHVCEPCQFIPFDTVVYSDGETRKARLNLKQWKIIPFVSHIPLLFMPRSFIRTYVEVEGSRYAMTDDVTEEDLKKECLTLEEFQARWPTNIETIVYAIHRVNR